MKFSLRNSTVALTLIALTAIIMQLSAQNGGRDANRQPRYKLVDLGTLGGPQSWTYGESTRSLSKNGIVGGLADTAVLNSNPNQNPYTIFGDAYLHHGFRWKDGVKTDLGALPGSNSSSVFWIDDRGLAVGGSLNGITDLLRDGMRSMRFCGKMARLLTWERWEEMKARPTL